MRIGRRLASAIVISHSRRSRQVPGILYVVSVKTAFAFPKAVILLVLRAARSDSLESSETRKAKHHGDGSALRLFRASWITTFPTPFPIR